MPRPDADAAASRLEAGVPPSAFAAAPAESRRGSWVPVAAVAVLLGLGAGFAGGYALGWRSASRAAVERGGATPSEQAGTSGRTYTDAPVGSGRADGGSPEHVPSASIPPGDLPTGPAAAVPGTEAPARIELPPASAPATAVPDARAPRVSGPRVTTQAADREPPPRRLTGSGSLLVESRPTGAQVTVDGRVVGRTPLILADVAAGSHRIGLQLPSYRPWATSLTVEGGVRTRVAASLEQ